MISYTPSGWGLGLLRDTNRRMLRISNLPANQAESALGCTDGIALGASFGVRRSAAIFNGVQR